MSKKVEEEMQDMIRDIIGDPVGDDVPAEELADQDETKPADQPVAEEQAAEEQAEDQEEPVEQEQPGEDPTQAEIRALRDQLAQLQAQIAGQGKQEQEDDSLLSGPEVPVEVKPVELEPLDEEEFSEALNSVEGLNKLRRKIVEDIRKGVLENVASLTQGIVGQYIAAQEMARNFYKENPDLEPFRDYCRTVAQQIQAQNPGLSDAEILRMTASTVREKLGLQKTATIKPKSPRNARPAFAPGSGGRAPAKRKATVADEFAKMRAL